MPCDAPQIVGRGHAGAIQVPVELLPIDPDVPANLGNAAMICAERAQVAGKIFVQCDNPYANWRYFTSKSVIMLKVAQFDFRENRSRSFSTRQSKVPRPCRKL